MCAFDALYADLVVWTQTEIVVECIYRDHQFFEDCIENARNVFMYEILLEIVGNGIPGCLLLSGMGLYQYLLQLTLQIVKMTIMMMVEDVGATASFKNMILCSFLSIQKPVSLHSGSGTG